MTELNRDAHDVADDLGREQTRQARAGRYELAGLIGEAQLHLDALLKDGERMLEQRRRWEDEAIGNAANAAHWRERAETAEANLLTARSLLNERDGGTHDQDCERSLATRGCRCGHERARSFLDAARSTKEPTDD